MTGGETGSLSVSGAGHTGDGDASATQVPRSASGAFVPDAIPDPPRPAKSSSKPAAPGDSRWGADPLSPTESVFARRKAERKAATVADVPAPAAAGAASADVERGPFVPKQTARVPAQETIPALRATSAADTGLANTAPANTGSTPEDGVSSAKDSLQVNVVPTASASSDGPESADSTDPASTDPASTDPASTDSSWEADPMSPSGSVFKLSPSIWDAPAAADAGAPDLADYKPASGSVWDLAEEPAELAEPAPEDDSERGAPVASAEELDATRPFLAAIAAEEVSAEPEPAHQPFTGQPATGQPLTGQPPAGQPPAGQPLTGQPPTSLPPPEWAPASLGISSAGKAAEAGPAFGGPGSVGAVPVASGNSGSTWGNGGSGAGQGPVEKRKRKLPIIAGIAAALVLLVGGGFLVLHGTGASSTGASGGSGKSNTKVIVTVAKGPEHVAATSPSDGTTDANGGAPIVVTFSEPLSPTSPMPTLKPDIKGSWQVSGDKATFIPAKGFWQHTKVTVTVPAGAAGVQSNGGGKLATPVTASFKTGEFSLVRLEQDLGQLGYLPLTWAPASGRRRRSATPTPSTPPPSRRRRARTPGSPATRPS